MSTPCRRWARCRANYFPSNPETAIKEIARHLSGADHPNLMVMVHGFNNPQPAVLDLYARAAIAIHNDNEISKDEGLVCVGYRWPSEKMGTPWRSCAIRPGRVADLDILARRHIHLDRHRGRSRRRSRREKPATDL